jgi:hypothetical protein
MLSPNALSKKAFESGTTVHYKPLQNYAVLYHYAGFLDRNLASVVISFSWLQKNCGVYTQDKWLANRDVIQV